MFLILCPRTWQKLSYLLREEQLGISLLLVMNLLSPMVCKYMILLKPQPNWGTNSPLVVFSHLLNDIPKFNACFSKEKLWHCCSWPASPADWTVWHVFCPPNAFWKTHRSFNGQTLRCTWLIHRIYLPQNVQYLYSILILAAHFARFTTGILKWVSRDKVLIY